MRGLSKRSHKGQNRERIPVRDSDENTLSSSGSEAKINTIKAAKKTEHIYGLVEKLQKKLNERVPYILV